MTSANPGGIWRSTDGVTWTEYDLSGIPTEVNLDIDEGMPVPCVAAFNNLQPIRKAFLTEFVGSISHRPSEVCRALSALADC